MLAYPHEVVQNHPLTSEGVIVHNNSWGYELVFLRVAASSNTALNPVRFALWTLRDEAAQRRLALRWASK
jgi:hypothetical protein